MQLYILQFLLQKHPKWSQTLEKSKDVYTFPHGHCIVYTFHYKYYFKIKTFSRFFDYILYTKISVLSNERQIFMTTRIINKCTLSFKVYGGTRI